MARIDVKRSSRIARTWLISTPEFHHWHHTHDEMRDHNYASMLPCWDWLSGTLHRAPQPIAARLRIEDKLPNSVALQLLHPFVPAPHAAAVAPEPGSSEPAAVKQVG
jgi:sterol desaturase/sphingolipid hydroxylase (fatty acid hydroxylase superfamily)